MELLMKTKLAIKKFVGNNEVFLLPILKFLLAFLALNRISSQLGFMHRLASKPVVLIIALAGSFLPINLTLVIIALITVIHLKYISLACAIVGLAMFLVLFLMYFRFTSEESVAGMLVPLSYVYKIPYVIPISMGLIGTPSSIVSVGCGAVIYSVLHFFAKNAEELQTGGSDILGQFAAIIDGILAEKSMFVYIASFGVAVLVVYLIRRLSIKYAWILAIGVGELTMFLTLVVANAKLGGGISVGSAFVGIIISTIINVILCYFCFDLNYDRIEKVQFEDDEYYYYVKAIPKNEYLNKPVKKKRSQISREASVRTRPQAAPIRTNVETPVREAKAEVRREEIKPVHRPVQRSSSDAAAEAIRNRTVGTAPQRVTKGPLGLSGGRPAGEGRRLQQQREAERNRNQ